METQPGLYSVQLGCSQFAMQFAALRLTRGDTVVSDRSALKVLLCERIAYSVMDIRIVVRIIDVRSKHGEWSMKSGAWFRVLLSDS